MSDEMPEWVRERIDRYRTMVKRDPSGHDSVACAVWLADRLEQAERDAHRYRLLRDRLDAVKFSDCPEGIASLRPDPDDPNTKYVCAVVLDYAIDAVLGTTEASPNPTQPAPVDAPATDPAPLEITLVKGA